MKRAPRCSVRAPTFEDHRAMVLLRRLSVSHLDIDVRKMRTRERQPAGLSSRSGGQLARIAIHSRGRWTERLVREMEIPPAEFRYAAVQSFQGRNRDRRARVAATRSEQEPASLRRASDVWPLDTSACPYPLLHRRQERK